MNDRVITIKRNNKRIAHCTANGKETALLAETFACTLFGGSVVALKGDLGAGKTVFASGIAKALGIRKAIISPTFAIMLVYSLSRSAQKIFHAKQLCHIDTYRLSNFAELIDIGIQEYLGDPNTISVVEWPEKIHNLLPSQTVYVHIKSR